MIRLEDHQWTAFAAAGWTEGLKMVCAMRVDAATKALATISPTDAIGIAKLQQEIQTYTHDVPSIETGLNEYLASKATAK